MNESAAIKEENLSKINQTTGRIENLTPAVEEEQKQEEEKPEELPKGDISLLPNPCTNISKCKAVVYGIASEPSFAWTGSEYGILWSYEHDSKSTLYFTRIDSQGNKLVDDMAVKEYESGSKAPSIVWTGSNYGLLWPLADKIYLMQLNPLGKAIGGIVDISMPETGSKSLGKASIAWSGSVYGVAWEQDSKVHFTQYDTTGSRIGNITEASTQSAGEPQIAWADNEYGIV